MDIRIKKRGISEFQLIDLPEDSKKNWDDKKSWCFQKNKRTEIDKRRNSAESGIDILLISRIEENN